MTESDSEAQRQAEEAAFLLEVAQSPGAEELFQDNIVQVRYQEIRAVWAEAGPLAGLTEDEISAYAAQETWCRARDAFASLGRESDSELASLVASAYYHTDFRPEFGSALHKIAEYVTTHDATGKRTV